MKIIFFVDGNLLETISKIEEVDNKFGKFGKLILNNGDNSILRTLFKRCLQW